MGIILFCNILDASCLSTVKVQKCFIFTGVPQCARMSLGMHSSISVLVKHVFTSVDIFTEKAAEQEVLKIPILSMKDH
jgi:hypothetical protein